MSKELKTKSELMEELEKVCDAMRPYFEKANVVEYGDSLRISTYSFFHKREEIYAESAYSRPQQYRPDPVAPADGRAVIVGFDGHIAVSRGCFSDNGRLLTYEHPQGASCGCGWWRHWCDYLDRSHHSDGWNRELEPDYNKKKANPSSHQE